jgi:hypothetical protein
MVLCNLRCRMEDTERITIPTLSRTRLGRNFSYPIGAERISSALASVPHVADLKLQFYFWSDQRLRWGHYEFLRVEYLNNVRPAEEWPISSLYKRSPQYRWES